MGKSVRNVLVLLVAAVVSIQAIAEPAQQVWRLRSGRNSAATGSSALAAMRVLEAFKPAIEGVWRIGFLAEKPVNTLEPGPVEGRLYFTQRVLAPVLVVPVGEGESAPEWVLVSLSPGHEGALAGLLERHGLVVEQQVSSRRVLAKRVAR